ncbi:MAG: SPOR domain-containing protein [Chitinophagaceae bacterium]|nr:SPOR domain-containing protein [Chitinophagaceae bacterium]
MIRLVFLLSIIISGLASFAQDSGNVVIHKDPRIDLLVNKQIEINELTTRNSRRSGPGYRILVISSNNRNKVIDAKATMYRQFPELKAYMMYQAPFFRLKVGNFREREEAEEYLSGIQKLFNSNVYVVPDTIEIRPEQE